jgi:uncharacterized protein (TIGR02266 family)
MQSRDKNTAYAVENASHLSELRASGTVATDVPRRQHPRHDVEIEVTLESESNFYLGLTENLSEGGLFIATHVLPPLGTQIDLSFKLPNFAEPIQLTGIVRWVREYSETSDASPGMGVRFESIRSDDIQHIRAFLDARAPLFYDED